jgi:hypothetical protein
MYISYSETGRRLLLKDVLQAVAKHGRRPVGTGETHRRQVASFYSAEESEVYGLLLGRLMQSQRVVSEAAAASPSSAIDAAVLAECRELVRTPCLRLSDALSADDGVLGHMSLDGVDPRYSHTAISAYFMVKKPKVPTYLPTCAGRTCLPVKLFIRPTCTAVTRSSSAPR